MGPENTASCCRVNDMCLLQREYMSPICEGRQQCKITISIQKPEKYKSAMSKTICLSWLQLVMFYLTAYALERRTKERNNLD